MIQRLAVHKGRGLVLLPTRELAIQVDESLNKVGRGLGLKTVVLIGGENMGKQIRGLKMNPHIVIATPGRLIDHLEQKTVKLDNVNILVLDEADRMLDMGFAPQLKQILKSVPAVRQTMLFSATMPAEIVDLAHSYMKLPTRVEVAPAGSTTSRVTQELYFVARENKMQLLKSILAQYSGSVLVFSRTKFGAKKIAQSVRNMGHSATEIHSNRSLNQRLEALNGFKLGKYRVLVATDIAARGIDVTGIELVLNYDLPEQAADYVHRIGRTGRASHTGHAISFATPDQKFDVRSIERLIKTQLPITKVPDNLPTVERGERVSERPERSGGFRGNKFGSQRSRPSGPSRYGQRRDEPKKKNFFYGDFIGKPKSASGKPEFRERDNRKPSSPFRGKKRGGFGNNSRSSAPYTPRYDNQF
jgi:ATP-dependent RNA helicase RhlE